MRHQRYRSRLSRRHSPLPAGPERPSGHPRAPTAERHGGTAEGHGGTALAEAPRPHDPTPREWVEDTPARGTFAALLPQLRRAVAEEGYATPTPIQAEAIPHLLEGRDILGCAQTGTGKTAAFTLPILQYLTRNGRPPARGRPRVLVLAPTRELAAQIGESIRTYGRHLRIAHAVIYGGVGQQGQVNALGRGVDIVVATPGRLLDLMQQGYVKLEAIEVFVLDEADRMLDMGFIHDIRRVIAALPRRRQSLFFSATIPPAVIALARTLVHDPVHITIAPEAPTVERIVQKVLFVDKEDKDALLVSLLRDSNVSRVLVFVQRKHHANKVTKKLISAGISGAVIHGNKSQGARTEALAAFKAGRVRVLVATDIAARGLDVDAITHVINYELPIEPEIYIHRIGRTGRAEADGDAISFCSAAERESLRGIERLIGKPVPIDTRHEYHSEAAQNATGPSARPQGRAQGQAQRSAPRGGTPRRHAGYAARPRRRGFGSRRR